MHEHTYARFTHIDVSMNTLIYLHIFGYVGMYTRVNRIGSRWWAAPGLYMLRAHTYLQHTHWEWNQSIFVTYRGGAGPGRSRGWVAWNCGNWDRPSFTRGGGWARWVSVLLLLFVSVSVSLQTYSHMDVHMQMYIHVHTCMCLSSRAYVYIYDKHVFVRFCGCVDGRAAPARGRIYSCIHIYKYMYVSCPHMYIYAHT